MEPNQKPTSEREWSEEEKEEFFSSQDAIKIDALFEGARAFLSNESAYNQLGSILEHLSSTGIHVTSITPPESGWLMSFYCPLCRETWFRLSPWAIKPSDGDFWRMEMCGSDVEGFRHNMALGMRGYNDPVELKPGVLLR